MKMKILNSVCNTATDYKFWSQKLQSYLIMKTSFLFWFLKYFCGSKREFEVMKEVFTVSKNQLFRKNRVLYLHILEIVLTENVRHA